MNTSRRGHLRPTTAALVVFSLALSLLSGFELQAEAQTVEDLGLRVQVSYTGGQSQDAAVGEARPSLPAAPTLPEGDPLPPPSSAAGGEFHFELTCDAPGANCADNPPTVVWEFGDGAKTTGGLVQAHAYTKPGRYTLRAVATRGSWFGEVTRTVLVSPHWADIVTVNSYDYVVKQDGPLGFWRFGETNGTSATDASGNGRHLTYQGTPGFGAAGAIVSSADKAIEFGAGEFANGVSPLAGGQSFTVEGWVKVSELPGTEQQLLSVGPPDDEGALVVSITPSGQIRTLIAGGVSRVAQIPSAGNWFHVAVTWNQFSLYTYVNGVRRSFAHDTNLGVDLTGEIRIGSGQDGADSFAGFLDEFALYDRELSQGRVLTHYQSGVAERIAEEREDRESIWVVSSLELFDPCRVADNSDAVSGPEIGRALFCPSPRTHPELPAPLPMPAEAYANGITGENCLDWWGACDLPKQYFDGPTAETTTTVDHAGLVNAGYIDGADLLVYDPLNCGDGWKAVRNGFGVWEVVPGSEDGCLTRGQWYDALIRAVDGRVARDRVLAPNRLKALGPDTCLDHNSISGTPQGDAYLRAVALGMASPTEHGGAGSEQFYCDLGATMMKGEVLTSMAVAMGVPIDPAEVSCGHLLDLTDETLGTGAAAKHPECERIAVALERGVPPIGDLECHWGSELSVCINPYDRITRAESATIIANAVTTESAATQELVLELGQDGPKPVNSLVTITAVARAPLSMLGEYTFNFPLTDIATRQCGPGQNGVVVADSYIVGDERRAVASCGYLLTVGEARDLTVTVTKDSATGENQITISGANLPPQQPTPSLMGNMDEGPGANVQTMFSSADPEGVAVEFEVASSDGPYTVGGKPADQYSSLINIAAPAHYWRLGDTGAGPVTATIGGVSGTATGAVTRGQAGALVDNANTSYLFGGGHVTFTGLNLNTAPGSKATLEMWMRWQGGDDQVVAALGEQNLTISDGFIGFSVDGRMYGTPLESGMSGKWTYVVAEFTDDLGANRLWLNGVEQNLHLVLNPLGNGGANDTSLSTTLRVGADSLGGGAFGGQVDEVALYVGSLPNTNRISHQEAGIRQRLAVDEDGRPLVSLKVEKITASTARITATALSEDANGTYTFKLRTHDGDLVSPERVVTGFIQPTQDAPVGTAGGIVSNEAFEGGPAVGFTLSGADPKDYGWRGTGASSFFGGVTHYRIVEAPEIGELRYHTGSGWVLFDGNPVETTNPNLTYTPEDGPYGDGTFVVGYQVLDEGYPLPPAWSPVRQAKVFVINTNGPPVCLDVLSATDEDTPKNIAFVCSDPEDDSLSYEIVSPPLHADLTGSGDSRTFTPHQDWCGDTSYTYRAYDGELYSEVQTVNVTVHCVNDAPTAPTGSMPTQDEDTSPVGTFATTDADDPSDGVDDGEWTFEVSNTSSSGFSAVSANITGGVVSVTQGSLTDQQAQVTFTPTADWCGSYTFYIRAHDGAAAGPASEVVGTLTCVNDAPTTPTPSSMPTVAEDNSAVQTFTTTDPDHPSHGVDAGEWTFEVSNTAGSGFVSTSKAITGGTVSVNQGSLTNKTASITFTPTANWCGSYTFYVRVSDGVAYSGVQTVTGTITCVNDAPTTPTINSSWGSRHEDHPNAALWTRTYTTTDPDTAGQTGGNRWCMQFREGTSGNWQPGNTSGNYTCPSSLGNYNFTLSPGKGVVSVQQGSLTNKTGVLVVDPSPNFVGSISMSVRFCDDGGACSGSHTQTLSVTHYPDTKIVTTLDGSTFRWLEYNSIGVNTTKRAVNWAVGSTNVNAYQPLTGDWDGDGLDDYGKAQLNSSNWAAYGRGDNGDAPWFGVNLGGQGNQVRFFAGDWDKDGDDDIGWWSNVNGQVRLRNMDTGGITCWGNPGGGYSECTTPSAHNMFVGMSPAAGDINNDDRDEVFLLDVREERDDLGGGVGMWFIKSATNGAAVVAPFYYGPKCTYSGSTLESCYAMAGDWDADGTETVAMYNKASGMMYWRNANSEGPTAGEIRMNTNYLGAKGWDYPG